jgi:hypothetical protein
LKVINSSFAQSINSFGVGFDVGVAAAKLLSGCTVGEAIGGVSGIVGSCVSVGVGVTAVFVGIGMGVESWETAVSSSEAHPIKQLSRQIISSMALFFIYNPLKTRETLARGIIQFTMQFETHEFRIKSQICSELGPKLKPSQFVAFMLQSPHD